VSINVPPPLPQDPGGFTAIDTIPGTAGAPPEADIAEATRPMWRRGLEVFTENRLAVVGLVIFLAVVIFSFLGPLVYHTDQIQTNLANANLPPGAGAYAACHFPLREPDRDLGREVTTDIPG